MSDCYCVCVSLVGTVWQCVCCRLVVCMCVPDCYSVCVRLVCVSVCQTATLCVCVRYEPCVRSACITMVLCVCQEGTASVRYALRGLSVLRQLLLLCVCVSVELLGTVCVCVFDC